MSVANTWFMGKKHDVKSFKEQNEEVGQATIIRIVTLIYLILIIRTVHYP
jgi:hypothetical protein